MRQRVKLYIQAKQILEIVGDGDHKLHREISDVITATQLITLQTYVAWCEDNGISILAHLEEKKA